MFKSWMNLATDVVKIAAAPVEIAADAARIITKPVADVAKDVVKEIKKTADGRD